MGHNITYNSLSGEKIKTNSNHRRSKIFVSLIHKFTLITTQTNAYAFMITHSRIHTHTHTQAQYVHSLSQTYACTYK